MTRTEQFTKQERVLLAEAVWRRQRCYIAGDRKFREYGELLNEILKELNDIKFSKKIENLENKLIEKFDEKSYSDLIKLKSKINKE